jgi:DnaJ-class molecular chaperone
MPPPAAPDELLVSYAQQIVMSLDEPCHQCGGKHSDTDVCGVCRGKGYQLTDAGRDLLAWLERWQNRY